MPKMNEPFQCSPGMNNQPTEQNKIVLTLYQNDIVTCLYMYLVILPISMVHIGNVV